MINESAKAMAEIDSKYLSPDSPSHVDMPAPTHDLLRSNIASVTKETYPTVGTMFHDAEECAQNAIYDCVYKDFVRAQLTLSASEALSGDRHRYQGLGDCFCLTEPSKADNPIVYASDGFITVTGYERAEVIPRNCRFLQGNRRDDPAARRVGQAVCNGQESVEFLLNYRKNGEPFWNLLYTAPLIDSTGRVAFFLGGQANCSSSVHSKPDIMRVLAASSEHEREEAKSEEEAQRNNPAKILAHRFDQVKTLRYRQKAEVEEEPGVKRHLVADTEAVASATRIERFYNAYSKYFVVKYPAADIQFASEGIGEVLTIDRENPIIGINAFKFLKQHMLSRDKSDWRHRIEVALKSGRAISLSLRLQTKRSVVFCGDEKYLTHWTPLKDLEGKTQWVVVCLCPTLRQ